VTLQQAIEASMRDWLDNDGDWTPASPAIIVDDEGDYDYGSVLHCENGNYSMVITLDGDFGSCTPATMDDVVDCARCLADMIN